MKNETFAEMYRRYAALVIKSVVAQTNDKELAEEICQTVFVKYYQHMDRIDLRFTKAWLLHASRNLLIDYWRKASTRNELSVWECAGSILEESYYPDLAGDCADRMFVSRMLEDLYHVNRDWYDVVDCVYVCQMTIAEAAKYLNVDSKVLSARMYRAKAYLRERYAEEYDGS